jgi:hypothetical protein
MKLCEFREAIAGWLRLPNTNYWRASTDSVDLRIEKTSYARSQAYQQWGTGYSGLEARSHVFPPLWALPLCGCLNADLVVTHPLDTVGRPLPTVTVLCFKRSLPRAILCTVEAGIARFLIDIVWRRCSYFVSRSDALKAGSMYERA